MSILNFRFRPEGELLVLQLLEQKERDPYYGRYDTGGLWRDAKVEDMIDAMSAIQERAASLAAARERVSERGEPSLAELVEKFKDFPVDLEFSGRTSRRDAP
jgi:hypothetical protein